MEAITLDQLRETYPEHPIWQAMKQFPLTPLTLEDLAEKGWKVLRTSKQSRTSPKKQTILIGPECQDEEAKRAAILHAVCLQHYQHELKPAHIGRRYADNLIAHRIAEQLAQKPEIQTAIEQYFPHE